MGCVQKHGIDTKNGQKPPEIDEKFYCNFMGSML